MVYVLKQSVQENHNMVQEQLVYQDSEKVQQPPLEVEISNSETSIPIEGAIRIEDPLIDPNGIFPTFWKIGEKAYLASNDEEQVTKTGALGFKESTSSDQLPIIIYKDSPWVPVTTKKKRRQKSKEEKECLLLEQKEVDTMKPVTTASSKAII
ncbi:hypothetical protein FNV43_RR16962 [Rhamnella rubrinervis]|uniref:Uncharacterized protein n=1 Tax=Rhamnella rubrinervis TaxID=2594499 RepID=A0A8K0GZQ8_9ROSA|nr:hypothetical protein FNV43_RR16962 [Rhamnella rubrinervis]